MIKPELLAPVGNRESLIAAVQNGADAVYLATSDFGARQYATNFDNEGLKDAIDYCHLRGVKVYLTLNILVTDREMDKLKSVALFVAREGIDAFIVQDVGVLSILSELVPNVLIHTSTQMTIHNKEGAKLVRELGCERVVLARELSADDVSEIVRNSNIETEIFIHGALCMSYSGQCLMSSIFGGRSGNRGRCAQPCRLPYSLMKNNEIEKEGYLLSPKDLTLSTQVAKIMKTNVTSLKIEGRMKGPDYVAATVSVFRQCIDEGRNATPSELGLLKNAFSRGGFTEGFFTGNTGAAMMKIDSSNDDIYKNRDEDVLKELKNTYKPDANIKKVMINFRCTARQNAPLILIATYKDFTVEALGEVVSKANNNPTTKEQIKTQLRKTGDTPFLINELIIDIDNNIYISLKDINSTRRELLKSLGDKVINSFKRGIVEKSLPMIPKGNNLRRFSFSAQIETLEQYNALKSKEIETLYIPATMLNEISTVPQNVVVFFPDIIKNGNMVYYKNLLISAKEKRVKRIKCGNAGILYIALQMGFELWGDESLNIFNSYSANLYFNYGLYGATLSSELNLKAIPDISSSNLLTEAVVYGHLTLMKTANCPIKSVKSKCVCSENKLYYLKDRKSELFPLICDKKECLTKILNSKPVYLADRINEFENKGLYHGLLKFTIENSKTCENIYSLYTNGYGDAPKDFTRGHYYRGVE